MKNLIDAFNGDKLAFLEFWQGRAWSGWCAQTGTTWAQFRAMVRAA